MILLSLLCLVAHVYALTGKAVFDLYKPDEAEYPYRCLRLHSYDTVFMGSSLQNDVNIDANQYETIMHNVIKVEFKVILKTADVLSDSERPQVVINRINDRLAALNVTGSQHLWLDIESLLVDNSDSDWVRQYLIDFSDAAANLKWTIGYFTDRNTWIIYTSNWDLPSSKNQLLWDKNSFTLDNFIPYGGWVKPAAVVANTLEMNCSSNLPEVSYDKIALESRVPVWLGTAPSTQSTLMSTEVSTASPTDPSNPPFNSTVLSTVTVNSTATPAPSESLGTSPSSESQSVPTTTTPSIPANLSTTSSSGGVLSSSPKYETSTKACSYLKLLLSFSVSLIMLERSSY